MRKRLFVVLCLSLLLVVGSSVLALAADPGFVDGRFTTTRKITVEVYDRSNPGGSPPENNFWTDFIKKGMLEKYNVEVEFVPVPRWTEVEVINNLLARAMHPMSASPIVIPPSRPMPTWAACWIWLPT